jgi:hypothetical protein
MTMPQSLRHFTYPDNVMMGRWLLLAMVAMILGAITGVGFFAVGGIFTPLSDTVAVIIGLALIPVVLGLGRIFRPHKPRFSFNTMAIGIIGLGLFSTGAFFLVLHHTIFGGIPETAAFGMQFFGIFLKSIWLFMLGLLILKTGIFEKRTGRAAILAGGAYLFVFATFPFYPGMPVIIFGLLIALSSFFAWAIWTRAALIKGKLS